VAGKKRTGTGGVLNLLKSWPRRSRQNVVVGGGGRFIPFCLNLPQVDKRNGAGGGGIWISSGFRVLTRREWKLGAGDKDPAGNAGDRVIEKKRKREKREKRRRGVALRNDVFTSEVITTEIQGEGTRLDRVKKGRESKKVSGRREAGTRRFFLKLGKPASKFRL